MLNIAGKWKLRGYGILYVVEHNPQVPANITWWDANNKEQQYGHGVINGETVIISWRGNIGNGSAESREVQLDPITKKPIVIAWVNGTIWDSLDN